MGLGVTTTLNTKMRKGNKKKRKHETSFSDSDAQVVMDFSKFPETSTRRNTAAFRDRIKEFLSSEAIPAAESAWLIPLRLLIPDGSPVTVPLHVVQEDVTVSSRSLYCDHCRVVGWSGHPVCQKRYHFIIRRELETPATAESFVDEWVRLQREENEKNNISGYLLHGMVHSNGYAHLLALNGRYGGSSHLSGRQLMSLWDRLSVSLSVVKSSVMDVSRKNGADLRLLHAVARGRSWYGQWGFEFARGTYALTRESYRQALCTISAVKLADVVAQRTRGLPSPRYSRVRSLVESYRSLAVSELVTLGDLFSFLLDRPRDFSLEKGIGGGDEIGRVRDAMVRVLRVSKNGWVARRALKGSVFKAASSVKILDWCFRRLSGTVTSDGAFVVRSRFDSSSGAVVYRLEALGDDGVMTPVVDDSVYPLEEQVMSDLKFLYDALLHPETIVDDIPQMLRNMIIDSATKLLDCKQFVKVYTPDKFAEDENCADLIRLWCEVKLSDQPKDEAVIPAELIVLPSNATLGDLKAAATVAFREVYVMLKSFQAEGLTDYGSLADDSMTLKFLVGSSGTVRLFGKCASKHGLGRFRMERGVESWTVKCPCGARDDDGERMLACDSCGVWQHTRCLGILNSDAIPAEFVCSSCLELCRDKLRNIDCVSDDVSPFVLSSVTCHGKAAAFGSLGLNVNLAVPSDVSWL